MASFTGHILAVTVFSFSFLALSAQPKKESKLYKVFTSGKQVTIKSSRNIQHVMLWTTSGHRVVEQREINAGSFSFVIPVNEKLFFLMVGLEGGKIYTEKIGIQ